MPARIWSGPELVAATRTWGMHEYSEKISANVAYIRADLVEQMADQLKEARLQIEYLDRKFKSTGTSAAVLTRIDTALSTYAAAVGSKEARG